MELRKYFIISNRTLIFYLLSLGVLFYSWYAFPSYIYGEKILNGLSHSGLDNKTMWERYNAFYRYSNFMFICALQFLPAMLIVLINITNKRTTQLPVNRYGDSIFSTLSMLNILITGTYLFMIFTKIVPSGSLMVFGLMLAFVLLLCLIYIMKKSRPEDSNDDIGLVFLKRIDTRLGKFGFPHPGEVFAVCWTGFIFILVLGTSFFDNSPAVHYTVNTFAAVLGVFGIAYLILGRHYKMKKMDELQKLIQLERANYIFNGFIILLYSVIAFTWALNIKIMISEILVPFGIIVIVSVLLVEKKYE